MEERAPASPAPPGQPIAYPGDRMTRTAFAAALALSLAGCATLKVETEYVEGADFKKYRTFDFLTMEPGPEEAPVIRDPQVQARVRYFVERELLKRGFKKVPGGDAA